MTVYKTLDDGSHQYDISVTQTDGTSQVYRTKDILSDSGGVYLQGRGTRVWKAIRVEDGVETGDIVALKDSWVDEYREREALLNARIRNAAGTEADRKRLGEMTVQVLAHGDVYVGGTLDRTRMSPEGECLASVCRPFNPTGMCRAYAPQIQVLEVSVYGSTSPHSYRLRRCWRIDALCMYYGRILLASHANRGRYASSDGRSTGTDPLPQTCKSYTSTAGFIAT